ncbi:META domain-containing protein [Leifsonia sp. NPDC058248]|uniref:META domain-containing protein n=1 Tax=Leifsonia sp. NPDC058248 TaxID=3346402 RepID=UPI0036DBD6F5
MKSVRSLRSAFAIAATVVALTALAGCSSSGSAFTGNWGQVATGQPSLTIKADGTWSGMDGCNKMSGKGSVYTDTFTFGPFASTLKACEGVTPWLNLAHTAKVDGSTLTVYRTDGEKIGTLAKR